MKRKNSLKNSRKRIIQATVAAVAGITVAVAAFRPVETSANGVLPGVESIVAQKMATEDKTYRNELYQQLKAAFGGREDSFR